MNSNSFIVVAFLVESPLFLQEIGLVGPVTRTVNGVRYGSLLSNNVISALQQRACMVSTIFMQNGASPHFANPVKLLLSMHFGSDGIISPHFPTNRAPRSPDLIPCDFWLWS
ncbi:hypothetical protein AVEN_13297-1 [Araneus ventricosus]|uniref:Uncharacterized protein n=1 Tax=Araneus ventricosus TaxID=182803 RepID=A0A4Y2UZE6_ARAVE|nr:hypothetical protein AVEN_13297-1 [Araneus ventricosus]